MDEGLFVCVDQSETTGADNLSQTLQQELALTLALVHSIPARRYVLFMPLKHTF